MRINDAVRLYHRHLEALGRSPHTRKRHRHALGRFAAFLAAERIAEIGEITADVLAEYRQELAFHITARGGLLARNSRVKLLSVVKGFTRFLWESDRLIRDPGAKLELPKETKPLPRVILSPAEIKKLLRAPDTRTNRGFRNRVVLEILYDTAIRRSEMAGIRVNDLDPDAGYVHVRGKGDKDRVVPLGARVADMTKNYVRMVRPEFLRDRDDTGVLILNRWGRGMGHTGIYEIVRRCARLAGIKKNVTVHSIRHTCATHMLRNGAPIRHVQEMLGHESLESTQIYTRVTINDLKEIHAKYHPGEKMGD